MFRRHTNDKGLNLNSANPDLMLLSECLSKLFPQPEDRIMYPDIPTGFKRKLDPVLPELPFRNFCSLPFRRPPGEKGNVCLFEKRSYSVLCRSRVCTCFKISFEIEL
jgi:hypothetical protein